MSDTPEAEPDNNEQRELAAWLKLKRKAVREIDEAWEEAAHWKTEYEIVVARLCGNKHPRDNGIIYEHEIIPKLTQERDKAMEDARLLSERLTRLELDSAFALAKLERERDEAREKYFAMRDLSNNATELAEKYKRQRDDAREKLAEAKREAENLARSIYRTEYSDNDTGWELLESVAGVISQIDNMYAGVREQRDEAREDATNYYARIGELESERDELKKIVEQRILVGAEIHNKANSLLKQSNRTEVECEALRKQLTAATSALRQIHLEVGDWIRSTIIVEE